MKATILQFLIFLFTLFSCKDSKTTTIIGHEVAKEATVTEEQSDLIIKHTKMFPDNTQLAFAIIENGNIEYYGIEKKNDTIYSIENRKSAFEVGSISKVFTSVLLSDMVLEGTLSLDSNINVYYDFKFNDNQQITFKELANHTSGLPRMASNFEFDIQNQDPFATYTEEKLLYYLANALELSKGKESKLYNYSNLGAGLLGYTLTKVKEESLLSLLKESIFSKYDMTNSSIGSENLSTPLVKGLNADGQPTLNWNLGPLEGAGSVMSTAEDLSKFVLAQFEVSDEVLKLARTETHIMDEKSSIGLGWHIQTNKDGENWIWHNGGTGGYTSCMVLNTDNKDGVIVLSNVSALSEPMDHIDKLCFSIMKTL